MTLGLWTRVTGALLAVHFLGALWIAHRGDTFLDMYDALVMVAAGLFLALHRPGKVSLDDLRERPRKDEAPTRRPGPGLSAS